MSKLVQKWDASYAFDEDELTMFAETQKSLAVPFQVPPVEEGKKLPTMIDENELWAIELVNKHEFGVEDIPSKMVSLQRDLQVRCRLAQRLCELMDQLEERVALLQGSHEKVRSKSLIMDSLWDGLIKTSQALDRLNEMMAPYIDYEAIYQNLISQGTGTLEAFRKAVGHLKRLQVTRHYLDAPLYIQRYEAIIITAAKAMAAEIITELDTLIKVSSSRLKDPTWSVLEEINSEYLLVVDRIDSIWMELVKVMDGGNKLLTNVVLGVATRYFSTRSSLIHHFFTKHAAKRRLESPSDKEEYLFDLIKIGIKCLAGEREVALKFFASAFPTFANQFKRHIEGILLPILKEIRSMYEDLPSPQLSQAKTRIIALLQELQDSSTNEDQHRVLGLLYDFFDA